MLDEFSPDLFTEPPRKAKYATAAFSDIVRSVFEINGIKQLYKHQAEGLEHIRKGRNVVIVAPTASGKSEIYIVPVIEAALEGKTSLILYPTKALSRDQLKRFQQFQLYGVRVEVYDGDTPQQKRKKIRENPPQIIITNADMLHFIILHNRKFIPFFKRLKYVVLDELHSYSGIFGAHLSNIFWRLKRILSYYAITPPQFIATSATIANAKEFSEELFGEPFELVEGTSSPRGEIIHAIINPYAEGYLTTTLRVARALGRKCLIFCNSHAAVERLGIMAKKVDFPLEVYRSGLSFDARRKKENDFKTGKIRYLTTTSALELGIDIGDVDAILLAGFPGSITRVRQRIGRAGRKGQQVCAVYIPRENPLDQYYAENRDQYLHGELENCYVNRYNENVAKLHLLAAARDLKLKQTEIEGKEKMVNDLIENGLLKRYGEFYAVTLDGAKEAKKITLRSGIGRTIRIMDRESKKFIGEREEHMAIYELFEGAIYLHGGRAYISEKLDLQNCIAVVKPYGSEPNEITLPLHEKTAEVIEESKQRDVFGHPLSFGKIHITDNIFGFTLNNLLSGRKVSTSYFEQPYIHEFNTYGIWIDLDDLALTIDNFSAGLHGLEHVSISMMPALTGADPKELGGISYSSGRMYVYDGVADGNGVTSIVFSKFEKIIEMAHNRLKNCPCERGCPKCILDPMCGNDNTFLNKQAALEIARALLHSR